jgi:predicted Zn finger-like uncharacterized protein
MPLKSFCPYCNTKYILDDSLAGRKVRCKRCKQAFTADGEPARKARPDAPPAPAVQGPPSQPERPRSRRLLAWGVGGILVLTGLFFLIFFLTPSAVGQKLNDLKAGDPAAREQALVWLATAEPDEARRAEVTAALEPLLFDGDVNGPLNPDLLLRAYLRWAGTDNVPAMLRLVENPTLPCWDPAKTGLVMTAFGKLKDERAVDALAERLPDRVLHDQAVNALKLMGPRAEPAVLNYLFDDDPGTRLRAGQLLADYGTPVKTIAAEAMNRLKSNQADVQRTAAAWFAENPPANEAQKAEAARLLIRLLDNLSPKVNAQALRALRLWATKDCLPQLLAFAVRVNKAGATDPALLDVLAQFPDETAAEAIALQLKNVAQRGKAVQALLKLGPAATKAVLGYINSPDAGVRKEARSIARLLKIPVGGQLEQTLADVADPQVSRSRAALQYLARLRVDQASRVKVSTALNAPLLEADKGIRQDALNAVKVWGTKENTAPLLKLLGDSPGRRDGCVIDILGALGDPAAAPALAQGLTDVRERGPVSKALKAMGPGAEEAVLPFLESKDVGARVEACRILADIGTHKSLQPLKDAMNCNSFDFGFVKEGQIASQKILARQ